MVCVNHDAEFARWQLVRTVKSRKDVSGKRLASTKADDLKKTMA
jgi:hypothetical protein